MSERLALVTGTSSGIGAALARKLLETGWEVAGVARRTPDIAHERYHHLAVDLQDAPAAMAAIESGFGALLRARARRRVGLANNAASAEPLGPVERLEAGALQRIYAINVAVPIGLMGLVLRASAPEATVRIVNLSSGAAVRPFPGLAAYCSSKAALRMAGMALAEELASSPAGARVAILSYQPGVVDTEMQASTRSKSRQEFPWVATFQGFREQGLLVAPELPAADIARFLESDGAERFAERRR
jgi:NAD(P)-dependent dehydrogenase (short-subunit alcohol dehydrogenase family)